MAFGIYLVDLKSELFQVKLFNEGINEPDRVILGDTILKVTELVLKSIVTGNVLHLTDFIHEVNGSISEMHIFNGK